MTNTYLIHASLPVNKLDGLIGLEMNSKKGTFSFDFKVFGLRSRVLRFSYLIYEYLNP